jgi:Cu(I)/Ag(I) efflux system protein CusF
MTSIKKLLAPVALLAAMVCTAALAQGASDMTDGEIRKVNKDTSKITIKHGEIKNMDMPPMTMVFNVKDKAWLDKFQAGDKVKFMVAKEDGKMVVTDLQTNP